MAEASRKPVIGLVGGIGSGKSTVARQMQLLGGSVFDADAAARRAMARPEVCEAIRRAFGEGVFDAAGRVDRRALAELAFAAASERRRLEQIVHPFVREALDRHVAEARSDPLTAFVVLDVPLLMEVGWAELCDRIILVRADRATRLARLAERGWDASELDRRENSQMPLDTKLKLAHDVVDNNASEAACLAQVRRIVQGFLNSTAS
jgi:dephospho-CoA kinase